MVCVVPLVHKTLGTFHDPGQVGGVSSKSFLRKEVVAGDDIGVQVLSPLSLDICLGEDLHPRVTNNPVTKVEDGGMSERPVRDGGRTLTELRLLRACCFRGSRRGNSFLLKYSLAQSHASATASIPGWSEVIVVAISSALLLSEVTFDKKKPKRLCLTVGTSK